MCARYLYSDKAGKGTSPTLALNSALSSSPVSRRAHSVKRRLEGRQDMLIGWNTQIQHAVMVQLRIPVVCQGNPILFAGLGIAQPWQPHYIFIILLKALQNRCVPCITVVSLDVLRADPAPTPTH